MGADPLGFYGAAFLAPFFFASRAYLAWPVALLALLIARGLTKKDPMFMGVFQRYLDERHAYQSLPGPQQWSRRAAGWGRGLPW